MRQRPKPFTVEIKKSRKPGAEPQSLFGNLLDTPAAGFAEPQPVTAEPRLFGPAESDALALAGQVFGTPQQARPETRILPDLTVRAAAVLPEEPERRRPERIKASLRPKPVKPKPIPIEIVAAPVVVKAAAPVGPRPVRLRVPRRDDTDLLPRGERWKRRLTPFAR